jgi:hypothetical protein
MSDLARDYKRLLLMYPKAYRHERGEDIVTTMLDATPSERRHPEIGDVLNLLAHGLRMRIGLNSNRFAGQVFTLAALPGLTLAAALCAVAFGFGEWHHPLDQNLQNFGPFLTFGPLLYLVWVSGAVVAQLKPSLMRRSAILCELSTLAAMVAGRFSVAHPPVLLLVMLMGFGLPSAFAPRTTTAPRFGAILVGLVAVGAMCVILTTTTGPYGSTVDSSFYWTGLWLLGEWMTPLLIVGVLSVMVLSFSHRRAVAGATAVLLVPWTVLSFRQPIGPFTLSPLLVSGGAAMCGLLVMSLVAGWVIDRKEEPYRTGRSNRA